MPETYEEGKTRKAVETVVEIVAESPNISELELVAALENKGFSHFDAERLCAFVPSAFAWALLKRMGLQSFPDHYVAFDKLGKENKFPIGRERYFTAALELASHTIEHGWSPLLTRVKFESVAFRSAEMGAVNKLLNSGGTIANAELLPLHVFRIPAEVAQETGTSTAGGQAVREAP
jgi:hypothetical protein